ncbi:methyltransferase domain-containing protein [Aquibacillus koreensis]|uniref:Methyltransferase domain-containing protein n=1 Tax=Aquibacillus koreensis TaxID=279446 RepID=A0A9X4AKA4_9BACI|nr:methyltransferase domain-containing protein [Aquibacillus koreensis]MCT2537774.1 methyltransferase domain-containing protein [Aquibacillus koreensis]MDC3421193.1 methyltransferase domain-containing protein [Aquibacillus koreensis]
MSKDYTDFLATFGISSAHPGGLNITKKWANQLDIKETTKLLDIGCGTGKSIEYLVNQYHCEITGLDPHKEMLNKAKNRLSSNTGVDLVEGSAESIPFPNDTFNIIISESVTSFTNISKSLGEYKRVLMHGGTLILVEITRKNDLPPLAIEEIKAFYGFTDILSEEEWSQLLSDHGFSVIQSDDIDQVRNDADAFDITEPINDEFFTMMADHYHMNQAYQNQLGARIYICQI